MGNGEKSSPKEENKKKKKTASILSVFMHADGVDKCLMFFGLVGATVDGISTPVLLYLTSLLTNDIGSASSIDADAFRHNIDGVCVPVSLSRLQASVLLPFSLLVLMISVLLDRMR